MKSLLCLFAMLLCLSKVEASFFSLTGDLTWNITDPQCSFRLKGKLQNLGAASGSLRLALWATEVPFPAPGTLVAEFPLGQLGSGYQFDNFTFKTKATLPQQNGEIYYTITLMEYTTAGWRNQLAVPTGTRTMWQGQFKDQPKWVLPKKSVIDPPAKLKPGNRLILKEQAMGNLNRFPAGWRERYRLDVQPSKVINYLNRNLDEKVKYKYTVLKRKYLGMRGDVGLLEMTYQGPGNFKFTEKVYLYFHGPNRGTYWSSVKGSLWGESTYPWTRWGTFTLKQAVSASR